MNNLTKALNEIKPWAAKSSTLPVLANVKLEANNVLALTTTNLEAMAVTTTYYAGKPFATTTNLKKLMAVTKGMVDPITFELEIHDSDNAMNDKLIVVDRDTKVTLNTISVSEFPSTPERGQHLGTLDLAGIDRIWPFTTDSKDNRPVLEHVLFKLGEDARFIAADGYKLATLTKDYQGKPTTLLVPANSLKKLKRRVSGKNMEATISVTNENVHFRMNNFSLTIMLLNATYPNYGQIIPKSFDCSFEANVKEWFAALKIVSLFAKETNGITRHTIIKDILTISAKDEDGNRIERVIPVLKQDGEVPPFALGLKHIETTLKACRNPTVRVKLQASGKDEDGQPLPTISALVLEDDTDWRAIVMPMHVDGGY